MTKKRWRGLGVEVGDLFDFLLEVVNSGLALLFLAIAGYWLIQAFIWT